jgi:hypothetical protein
MKCPNCNARLYRSEKSGKMFSFECLSCGHTEEWEAAERDWEEFIRGDAVNVPPKRTWMVPLCAVLLVIGGIMIIVARIAGWLS